MINGDFARVEAANRPFAATTTTTTTTTPRRRRDVAGGAPCSSSASYCSPRWSSPCSAPRRAPGSSTRRPPRPTARWRSPRSSRPRACGSRPSPTSTPRPPSAGRTVLVALPAQLSTRQRDALAALPGRPRARCAPTSAPSPRWPRACAPSRSSCPNPPSRRAGCAPRCSPDRSTSPAPRTPPPTRRRRAATRRAPRAARRRWSRSATAGARSPSSGTRPRSPTTSSTSAGNAALAIERARRPPATCSGTCRCRRRPSPGRSAAPRSCCRRAGCGGRCSCSSPGWRSRCGGAGASGRVVTEDLPVVVPAGETVRGRARLYRRAGARDRAAAALRADARRDLAGRLGVPRGCRGRRRRRRGRRRAPGGLPGRWAPSSPDRPRPTTPRWSALAGELDRLRAAVRDASGATPGVRPPRRRSVIGWRCDRHGARSAVTRPARPCSRCAARWPRPSSATTPP